MKKRVWSKQKNNHLKYTRIDRRNRSFNSTTRNRAAEKYKNQTAATTDDHEKNSKSEKKDPQIRINPDRDHHLPVNYRARLDDKPSGFKTFGSETKHFTRINMTREVPKLSFFFHIYNGKIITNISSLQLGWYTRSSGFIFEKFDRFFFRVAL